MTNGRTAIYWHAHLYDEEAKFTANSPGIANLSIGKSEFCLMSILQLAYAANLIILAPVLVSMFSDGGKRQIRAFQNQVENSDGLRLLVASLWSAIFLLSIAGLFQPKTFVPVLLLQVIYKLIYLVIYVVPTARVAGLSSIPQGLSLSFLIIVIIWPILIALSSIN